MSNLNKIFCLIILSLLPPYLLADGKFVTVKVNVLSGGCVLNSNEDISVDFGDDIVISQIDSGKYIQPIHYNLYCDSTFNDVYLNFDGVNGETANSISVADKKGLNIKLYIDNKDMLIGRDYSIDNYLNPPSITAKLALADGIRPSGGEFSTAATLTVGYN